MLCRGPRLSWPTPRSCCLVELLKHLIHMEARWLRWDFMAEQLHQPWGDEDESGRWQVDPEETATELLAPCTPVVRARE